MSGPIRAPLRVKESDGSVVVLPCQTVSFNAADFTVAKTGNEATISIDSTGAGAALTDTYVGYGNASNLLTGEAAFTYDATNNKLEIDTAGTDSEPELSLKRNADQYLTLTGNFSSGGGRLRQHSSAGNAKNIVFECVTNGAVTSGNMGFNFQVDDGTDTTSFLKMIGYPGKANQEILFNENAEDMNIRMESSGEQQMFMINGGQDNVGLGTNPSSGVERLHIVGTGSGGPMVRLESSGDGSADAPLLELYSEGADDSADDLGAISWYGKDDAGNRTEYIRIEADIKDATNTSEDGRLKFQGIRNGSEVEYIRFEAGGIVINETDEDIDFRIEGKTDASLFRTDAFNNRIGISRVPASAGALFQVDGTVSSLKYNAAKSSATVTLSDDECSNGFITLSYDAATQAVTMPTAATGMCVTIARTQSTNAPTIAAATGEKINTVSAPSVITMGAQWSVVVLHGITGTGWVAYEPAVAS